MGKLSIIPGRDNTRDYARRTSKEEEKASRAAAAVVVAGGAVSRSSAASSAIADSAAADRDRRFHAAVDHDHPRRSDDTSSQGGRCAGRRSACDRPGIANRTDLPSDVIVGSPGDSPARRRCRVDDVLPVATRLRRNTWHADRTPEDESCVVEAPRVGARRSDAADSRDAVEEEAEQQRALDASGALGTRRWDARIAGDERRRTCCATDVASPPQQQARRPRERGAAGPAANSAGGGRLVVERRRSRRSATSAAARGRSVAAPDTPETDRILRSTVDGIANAAREGASGRKFAPKGGADNACERVGASPVSVFEETRRRPSDDVDAERVVGSLDDDDSSSSNGATSEVVPRSARLIEIADSSCATRCLAGQAADGTRSLGKTIARLVPDESPARSRTKTDTCWRSPAARLGFVVRTLLLGLLAKSLLCDAVLGAPSSASIDLDGPSVVYEDEKEPAVKPGSDLREGELEIIRRSIVQGLGLQRIPDASKANVSQVEYERAHRKYLKQVQLSHDGQGSRKRRSLHVFEPAERPGNRSSGLTVYGDDWRGNHRHSLYFPVAVPDDEKKEDVTVDHASLRFLLQGDHRRPRELEVLVYLRTSVSRRLLLRSRIPQAASSRDSRWLELDSTEIAATWLDRDPEENHGLELEFLHDGQPTRREISHARLNVFTTSETDNDDDDDHDDDGGGGGGGRRRKRYTPEEVLQQHVRRSDCKSYNNKRCCRHEMTVMFKDLKGFDFIVFPKSFDAGFCKGRCPPLYNPAHHHALLQSLLWKEDRKRVPKPCCAPSKLNKLMVIYFDEKQPTELQVSYWQNITVEECACS